MNNLSKKSKNWQNSYTPRYISVCLFLLSICFVNPYYLTSQEKERETKHEVWVDARVGAGLGDRNLGIMVSAVNASFQVYGPVFVSTRGFLGGSAFEKEKKGTTIEDIGGLIGYFSKKKDFRLSASVGMSYTHAQYFSEDYFYTLNVPCEFSAYYIPNHVGFGLTVYFNTNTHINNYGATLGLQVRFY